MKWLLSALSGLALVACSQFPGRPMIETLETNNWREVATTQDQLRIAHWRATFTEALAEARAAGHSGEIEALGALADPDAAVPYAAPAPGDYRCRIIKIGARGEANLPFIAYPYYSCRIQVEKDLIGLAKLTGSQRPVGLLMPDDELRAIFLGTLVLGDESRAMRYSADPDRDVAGMLQRVGETRWRLVLPEPRFESRLDLIELVQETP